MHHSTLQQHTILDKSTYVLGVCLKGVKVTTMTESVDGHISFKNSGDIASALALEHDHHYLGVVGSDATLSIARCQLAEMGSWA